MKRKVIKQGNNTLTVTLPRDWTDKHSIKAGDEISMEDFHDHLLLSSGRIRHDAILNLDLRKVDPANTRDFLSNSYRLGFDELHVIFNQPSDLKAIQHEVDKLLGFEVINATKASCDIKAVASMQKEEFNDIFRKAHMINLLCFENLKEDIQKAKYPRMAEMQAHRDKVLALTDCCRRILNKHGLYDQKLDKSVWVILVKMNYMNSVQKDIYEYLVSAKNAKLSRLVVNYLESCEEMYRLVMDGYFKQDLNLIDQCISMKKKIYNNAGNKDLEKTKGADTVILSKLLEMIKYVYGICAPSLIIIYKNSVFDKNRINK